MVFTEIDNTSARSKWTMGTQNWAAKSKRKGNETLIFHRWSLGA